MLGLSMTLDMILPSLITAVIARFLIFWDIVFFCVSGMMNPVMTIQVFGLRCSMTADQALTRFRMDKIVLS